MCYLARYRCLAARFPVCYSFPLGHSLLMGYGIVLHLDDVAARALVASEGTLALGEHLLAVLGQSNYPAAARGAASGPWSRLGAFHSSHQVFFEVTPETIEQVSFDEYVGDGDSWAFQESWTPGRAAAATRELLRSPVRQAELAVQGPAALYGADRTTGRSLASAWFFYADALSFADSSSAATLGEAAARLMETHLEASASLGSHASALNKVGALTAPGAVRLVWSGNRVCAPSALTEREAVRLR